MRKTFYMLCGAALLVSACTDDQLRRMAESGTYEGKTRYRIFTEVRLPASEEKVAELQKSTVQARGNRLCPTGFKVVEEGRYVEVEKLYDTYWGGYWGGGYGGWNAPRYRVAEQPFYIVCTNSPG